MKVASIFCTVDGEVTYKGPWHWTVFLRTGGCNLRCWKSSGFCDAPHTLEMNGPYAQMSIEEVVADVIRFGDVRRCTITGGEPLLQFEDVQEVSAKLSGDYHWDVTLETSGSISFNRRQQLRDIISVIVDLKPPSTEMSKNNRLGILQHLWQADFVKIVLQDEEDYRWALDTIDHNPTEASIAFGVRWGYLRLETVADWLRRDQRFGIMLNMQSHKYIWDNSHPTPVASLKQVDFMEMVAREH